MPVVADTGPILAAANRNDEMHDLAAALIGAAGRELLVPEPVVTEVDWLLRERVGPTTARRFLEALVDGAYVRVTLSPSVFAAAVELDRRHADLDIGFVDAAVMAVADSTRSSILTFDFRDFRATKPMRGGAWRFVVAEADVYRWRRR